MQTTDATWVALFTTDAVAPGQMIGVDVGEHRMAVYNVNGRFFATQNVCTHAFAILSDGWLDDAVIECPLHGGRFEVSTGRVLCGPAEEDLQTFEVRVVYDTVEVRLPDGA